VGDCFLYTNSSSQRLQYYVGGQVMTLCHLDRPMYLLGYLSKDDRVYLMDKGLNIVSYKVRRLPPSASIALNETSPATD
jgi:coatomer subunit beta'